MMLKIVLKQSLRLRADHEKLWYGRSGKDSLRCGYERKNMPDTERSAQAVVDYLFENGLGQHADRLMLLVKDNDRTGHSREPHSNLGGWCKQTVLDQVLQALDATVIVAKQEGIAEGIERAAQVTCKWCGEEGYRLVFHHDEWRHYRNSDNHVEYCNAHLIRCLLPDSPEAAK